MTYNPKDKYFLKAKELGYRARSAFKLIEIQEKFGVFKNGQKVLDLGCSPGSWLQVIKELTGEKSKIIGIDLKKTEAIKGVYLFEGDIFDEKLIDGIIEELNIKDFDVISSDMAPNTSGIFDVDQYKSVELNVEALNVMKKYLKKGGFGIFKVFKGEDFNDFWFEAKKIFPDIKTFRVKSSRNTSTEIFCVGKKG